MTPTPGAYLKQRRSAAGLSAIEVASQVATEPRQPEHLRADWIEQIEADVVPASFNTIVALRNVYAFDLEVLAMLAAIAMGLPQLAPELCRICGCSWEDPCIDEHQTGCSWVEPGLCSACAS